MATYSVATPFVPQFTDSSGNLLSGGKLKAYLRGTSTPTNMYSDNAGTSLGSEVNLNARGEPETSGGATTLIFLSSEVEYKFELLDAADVSVWSLDSIANTTGAENVVATVAALKLLNPTAGQWFYTQGYYAAGDGGHGAYLIKASASVDGYGDHTMANGTIAVLQHNGEVTYEQYGAKGDGANDDYAAMNAAITSGAKKILGTQSANYRIDTRLQLLASDSNLILDFRGAKISPNGASTTGAIYIPAVGDGDAGVAGASNVKIENLFTDGTNAATSQGVGIKSYDVDGLYLDNIQNDNWSLSGCIVYGQASNAVKARLTNIRGTGNTNHALAIATLEEETSRVFVSGVFAWSNGLGFDLSSGSAEVRDIHTWSNTNGGMKSATNDNEHIIIDGLNSYQDGQGFYTNGTYRLLEMDNINIIEPVSHGLALNHAGTTLIGSVHIEAPGGQGFYQFGPSKTLASNISVNNSNERGVLVSAGDFQCSNIRTESSDLEGVDISTTGYVQIGNIISIDDCVASENVAVAIAPSGSGGFYDIKSVTAIDTRGTPEVTIAVSVGGNATDALIGVIRKSSNIAAAISDSGTDTRYIDANGSTAIANDRLGFFSAAPVLKQTVTGAKGGNVALTNLLTALQAYGLLTDSTT